MTRAPQVRMLPDGRRLHLQDGPIDLVIEAFGEGREVDRAYRAAVERFTGLLDELCAELRLLRSAAESQAMPLTCAIARRMHAAVAPYAGEMFITPMAAVAGAVAEAVLAAMTAAARLDRAYVNNGGDIALHLAAGQRFTVGLADLATHPHVEAQLGGTAEIRAGQGIAGVATSGRHGRSFSLGIADAVTVLASNAPAADAAATVIANAVDLPGHPAIRRVPACELQPESDLGGRLVTREVARLSAADVAEALAAGVTMAERLVARGLIAGAALRLQGESRLVGIAGAPLADKSSLPAHLRQARSSEKSVVHA